MSDFAFAAPQWIHLLWVVLAFVGAMIWLDRRGSGALGRFVAEPLQANLVERTPQGARNLRILFLGLAGAFLVLALMRPQWGIRFISTPRVGAEIMICLDVSKSMLAEDVTPNRLERAKAELRDLLTYLDGDQVGLIAFAGRASVLAPLTPDFGFLRLVLDEASPASVTRGGTRLEEPIRKAVEGFGDVGEVSRSILLITDGEDHDSFPLEAAKEAAERGVRILAVGFGDEAGSEIVITDPTTGARSTVKDADGKPVRSRLDGETLRQIALSTGGAYIPAGTGVLDLESIYERHIAGLTRGQLDGRDRAVRNDAFQWAILAALLCLLVAVAATAGKGRRSTGPAVAGLLFLIAGSGFVPGLSGPVGPNPALAQKIVAEDPDAVAARLAAAAAATEPAPGDGEDAAQAADATTADGENPDGSEEAAKTKTPRELYNEGLFALEGDYLDAAEQGLTDARDNAGLDAETRFRATYNLGWVEVKRANEKLEAEPEEALKHLHRAADWFREGVSLRKGHVGSRRNLEIVLKRALALADSLAERGEDDVPAQLEALIEAERELLGDLRSSVEAAARSETPSEVQSLRSTFREQSAKQLEILSESQGLSEHVGEQLAALEGTPDEELDAESRMRRVQFTNLLHYLHRARERMGQTRSQLRRLEAERSYRRGAASLAELKRARDQLRDPLAVLDGLIGDSSDLARMTAAKVAIDRDLTPNTEAPAWLTPEHLLEEQSTTTERTTELLAVLEAGASQASDPSAATGEEVSAEQERLLARVNEALPQIEAARGAFQLAQEQLDAGEVAAAVEPQGEGIQALSDARELFLDLRGLVQTLYRAEKQIEAIISPAPAEGRPPPTDEQIRPALPALVEIQTRNLERGERVGELIKEELTEDPETAEAAEALLAVAQASMRTAEQALELAAIPPGLAAQPSNFFAARQAVAQASVDVENLVRLFFSIVQHLKETIRRQIDLGDATEEVAALESSMSADELAPKLGPLAPRQDDLAERSGAISQALREHAAALAEAPPSPDQQGGAGPDPATFTQAAEHVESAQLHMGGASVAMTTQPLVLKEARAKQTTATEELLAALALLEPPSDEECDNPQPGEDGEEEKPEEPEEGDEGEQEEQQPQQAAGQESPPEEAEPEETDPNQAMQGVRDREAERRAERNERAEQAGYEPVDKDW